DAVRSQDVGLDRVDRLLEDQPNADGGSEMEYDAGLLDELVESLVLKNRSPARREPFVAFDRLQIRRPTGREVVDDRHLLARRQQRLGEMRADESGPARDQHPHAWFLIGSRFLTGSMMERVGLDRRRIFGRAGPESQE